MPYVSDLLTAAAASVTGTPTPTRTWQWLRDGIAISGATSATYTVDPADEGSQISVRQIESNFVGADTATSVATSVVLAFDPIALFASGEEGAWYDPSDLSTMYVDAAGTTPVIAAGQPVGLILDKSKGLAADSPELFDGAFETLEEWTNNGDGSWSVLPTETSLDLRTFPGFTLGKNYILTFDITITSGAVSVYNAFSAPNLSVTTSGSKVSVRVSANAGWIIFRAGVGTTATISNISSKELPGNHATQTTSAARPVLQVTGTTPATLGSELVANGTFDTATGWVTEAGWTISGGAAECTGSSRLYQTGIISTNKTYAVSFDVTSYTSGEIAVYLGNEGYGNQVASSAGSHSFIVTTSGASNTVLYFDGYPGGSTFIGSIDNISVKEVVTWADPKWYLDFDGVDDSMSATFAEAQAQPNSIGVGFKFDAYADKQYDFVFDSPAASAAGSRHVLLDSLGNLTAYAGANVVLGSSDISDNVVVTHFNTPNSFARKNGSVVFSAQNTGPAAWSGIVVGSDYTGGARSIDGRIYSFVGINRTLTAGEIDALESYLADKSGVTLP
jgi:hypothetical protein